MTLRILALALLLPLCSLPSRAQSSPAARVVHLCAATPMNQSRRLVDTKWARTMLMRELKFERKQKHSPVVIESTALDAQAQEAALDEAKDKGCDFIVLTTVMDPVTPGRLGPVIGPGGFEQQPQIVGNVDPNRQLAMTFKLIRPGHPKPVAEGVSAAPVAGDDENGASSETMRAVAARVAGEIRKPRDPVPD